MTTYNTGNPVPSTAVKDLYDNAENLDAGINGSAPTWSDRLGRTRRSWDGLTAEIDEFIADNGLKRYDSWTQLQADTSRDLGFAADVIGDEGTHTDPVSGDTVPNSGQYRWTGSAWEFLRADMLASKADIASVPPVGAGAADTAGYADTFVLAESRLTQTANSSAGGSYVVASAPEGGMRVSNSSSTGYRQVASLYTRRAGLIARYAATWVIENLSGSNGRAGIAIGPAGVDRTDARIYIYRGDGVVYSINGAGGDSIIYLSASGSRVYGQGDSVSMEISVDADGAGTISVRTPGGERFEAPVSGIPVGRVWAQTSTYGTTRFFAVTSETIEAVAQQVVATHRQIEDLQSEMLALSNLLATVVSPGSRVPVPAEWASPVAPLVDVYRLPGGVYAGAFNPDLYRPFQAADQTVYVDPVAGNDSNSGTEASPKRSLSAAVSVSAGNLHVLAKGGLYAGAQGFDGAAITASRLVIESADGNPVVSTRRLSLGGWTSEGGGVHSIAVSGAFGTVVDATNPSADGDADWLLPRGSLSEVQDAAGTYYHNGTRLYIRTHDSRQPDASVVVYDNQPNFVYGVNGSVLWMSDVRCLGGDVPLRPRFTAQSQSGRAYLVRCEGSYGCGAASGVGNGMQFYGKWEGVLVDCRAVMNRRDGFNYHGAGFVVPNIVEIGCIGNDNGHEGANGVSGSHNGSTMHEAGTIVRVNGTYLRNLRNIHDVSDVTVGTNNGYWTHSWNLGCRTGESRGSAGAPDSANGWRMGHPTAPGDLGRMWLYDCSNDAPGFDRSTAGSGATIYSRGFSGDGGDQPGSNIVEVA